MGRLLTAGGALLAYLCVATVLTAGVVGGYLWTHGYLDKGERSTRMVAVARGIDIAAPPAVEQAAKTPQAAEQPVAR